MEQVRSRKQTMADSKKLSPGQKSMAHLAKAITLFVTEMEMQPMQTANKSA